MGLTNIHPDFQNRSLNYFTSSPSDKGLRTENPRNSGIRTILDNFRFF